MAIIMSWGECTVEVAPTGALDALGTPLTSLGEIEEKSVSINVADGTKLQAYASGHKLVAQEEQDGDITVQATVIEPELDLLSDFLDSTYTASPEKLAISSFVITEPWSVKITPRSVGGRGVTIRKAAVKYRPGMSEEKGRTGVFTFTVLKCQDGELLTEFTKV